MTIKEKLDDLLEGASETLEEISKKTDHFLDNLKTMGTNTQDDFTKFYDRANDYFSDLSDKAEEKAKEVVNEAYATKVGNDFMETFKKYASNPKELKVKLKEKQDQYNTTLNDWAMDDKKKRLAGFIDGLCNSILATEYNRRPRSDIYTQHKKYGAITGWGASAWATLSGRILLGAVPWITHGYKFAKNAYTKAAEQNAKPEHA